MAENQLVKHITQRTINSASARHGTGFEFAELVLSLKNNWVYRTDFSRKKVENSETKFRMRFDTEEAGIYHELAKMGMEGWQVTHVLEADIHKIGISRVYFLFREIA